MKRPRADLVIIHLGAPRVEGHLFVISCHNSAICRNGQSAHRGGVGSSFCVSSDGFSVDPRKMATCGAELLGLRMKTSDST